MKNIIFCGNVGLLLQTIPFSLLLSVVYILTCILHAGRGKIELEKWKIIIRMLFTWYIVELIILVWIPPALWDYIWRMLIYGWYDPGAGINHSIGGFNFVPILLKVLTGEVTVGMWVRNMLGLNTLMFVPFGIMFPIVNYKKRKLFQSTIKCAAVVVCVIEIVQPLVGRTFDIDDVICNMIGVLIGYGIFATMRKTIWAKQ